MLIEPVLCLATGMLDGTITKNGAPMSAPYAPFVDVFDSQYGFREQATDGNGYYSVQDLPDGAASVYAYASQNRYIGQRNVTILNGQTVTADFDWSVGTVSGGVTRNGVPLTGAVIDVADSNNNWYRATTNGSGGYQIDDATAGAVSVYCHDSTGRWLGYQTATVTREGTVTVNFAVLSVGSVTGEVRKNGALVENARIDVLDFGGNWHTQRTNESGIYSIPEVAAGAATLYCYTPAGVFVQSRSTTVPDGNSATENFAWFTSTVQGTVTKLNTTPPEVAGALIISNRDERTTTDANGFYSFEVLPGPVTLACYAPNGYQIGQATADAPQGGTITVNFVWGNGSVRGTITHFGQPMEGATVEVVDAKSEIYSLVTLSDGAYRVDELPLGNVTVTVRAPQGEYIGARTGMITAGGELVLDLDWFGTLVTPDPFIPTGGNAAHIALQAAPGQSLMLDLWGSSSWNAWSYENGTIPLTEDAENPGLYTADWTALGLWGGATLIWPDDDYQIVVYDSTWNWIEGLDTQFSLRGVSMLSCSPSVLTPGTNTVVISAACAPALTDQLEVRVYKQGTQTLVQTLLLGGEIQGAPTVTWDGKNEAGIHVPSGDYELRVRHRTTGQRYGPTATLHMAIGWISLTAAPSPFSPTGCNAATITAVLANVGQTDLRARVTHPNSTQYVNLTETATPGRFEGFWQGLSGDVILPDSNNIQIIALDSRGNQSPMSAILALHGVTNVTANPTSFGPTAGETTTITANTNAVTGLHLEMRILRVGNVVRVLDNVTEGPSGVYTCVWDGKDDAGVSMPGPHTIQVYNEDCNPKKRYPVTGSVSIGIGVTSIEMDPDPFVPTGCNSATIRVSAYPSQINLRAKIQHPLEGYTTCVPLDEAPAGSGVYEATWNATAPANACWQCGGSPPSPTTPEYILPGTDNLLVKVQACSYWPGDPLESPVTRQFSLHSITSVVANPIVFCPQADMTTLITAVCDGAGLDLEAHIERAGVVETLPMTEASGAYTCVWDGRNESGVIQPSGMYTIRIFSACPSAIPYYSTSTVMLVDTTMDSIAEAKAAGLDPHWVCITGPAVITKITTHEELLGDPPAPVLVQDGFYAQDVIVSENPPPANTTGAGIRIVTSDTHGGAVVPGAKITSLGGLVIEDGNGQAITNPVVTIEGTADYPIKLLSIIEIGGPLFDPPIVPDTTGMLVRISGECKWSDWDLIWDPIWGWWRDIWVYYVDDGSGAIDGREPDEFGNPIPGIRLWLDPYDPNQLYWPTAGDCVTVEGIAGYLTATMPDESTRIVRQMFHNAVNGVQIYSPSATGISWHNATIVWDTNIESNSQVAYDTAPRSDWDSYTYHTDERDNNPPLEPPVLHHTITLPNLAQGTTYYYRVRSGASGVCAVTSQEYSFPTRGPEIMIAPDPPSNVGPTGATIAWQTRDAEINAPLDTLGEVHYGTTPACPLIATCPGPDPESTHTVNLTGLGFCTTCYYKIVSKAPPAYPDKTSTVMNFRTKGSIVISGIGHEITRALWNYQATVTWATDISSSSEVRYGTTPSCNQSAFGDAGTSHSVILYGLSPHTTYYYCVKSTSEPCYWPAESCGHTFETPQCIDFRNIEATNITQSTADIHWETYDCNRMPWHLNCTSRVEYAPTVDWDNTQSRVRTPQTGDDWDHTVHLSGLPLDTEYTYRVWSSIDPGDDGVSSETYTFKTQGPCEEYDTIGAAKAADLDPHPVCITGPAVITKVVTHEELQGDPPTPVTVQDGFYAQDVIVTPNGNITGAGIYVVSADTQSGAVVAGAKTTYISGLMREQSFTTGEQTFGRSAITNSSFTIEGSALYPAIAMTQKSLMGPFIDQNLGSRMDTTGALVRIFGYVNLASFTGGGLPYFYVDDGSGAIDDREDSYGIRIVLPIDAEVIPTVGDYVMVEGWSAYEIATGGAYTNVRTLVYPTVTLLARGLP